ncbi:hypothetical protein Q8F55_006903 [Vanrija albida]|uniref:Uncharacterized protein n=1 Tax=Vanrija albida TaxID=181172 RepID=A0ABR3PYE4_9TREE
MNTTSREPERNPAPRGSGARHRDPTPDEAEYAAVACFAPAGWFEGAALPAARAPASPSAPSEPETAKALLLGAPAAVAALTPHLRADTVALTPDAPEAGLRPTAANVAGWAGWLAEGGGRRFVYAGCGAGGLLAALRRLPRGLVLVSEAPGTLGLGYVAGCSSLVRTTISRAPTPTPTPSCSPRAPLRTPAQWRW